MKPEHLQFAADLIATSFALHNRVHRVLPRVERAADLLDRFAAIDAAGLRKAHAVEDGSTKATWRPPMMRAEAAE